MNRSTARRRSAAIEIECLEGPSRDRVIELVSKNAALVARVLA